MAVALRALRVKGSPGGVTSTTIVAPSGVQAGDFLLLLGGSDTDTSQAAFVGPDSADGFDALTPWGGVAGGANVKLWTRWATNADVGKTYTLTVPSGSSQVIYLAAFTGVDPSSPIAAAPVHADGGSATATALPAPSITPDVTAFGLFAWFTKGGSGSSQTITAPSGSTSLSSSSSAGGTDATGYTRSALAREDLTAQASGTRTATLSGTARRWSNVSLALRPAVTARSTAVGQPAEVDTAQPVGRTRRRSAGQASASEVATPVARARRRDIGQAVDLEQAIPVSARRPGEARQSAEVDTASPVRRSRRLGVGQAASEADSTTALGRLRRRVAAFAAESGLATALVRLRRRDVAAPGAETDAAQPVGRRHARGVGEPAESDVALPLGRRTRRRTIGQALDTSSATAVRRGHRRPVATAIEFDIAAQLGESTTRVTDADYATAIASRRRRAFGTLRVDWTGAGVMPTSPGDLGHLDAMVSSIEIERALDGDLPEGAGLIDGYATASLKARLGGRLRRDPDAATVNADTKRLAEVLSPFRADSPLVGKRRTLRQVTAELGIVTAAGPRSERLFSGPLRDLDIDEGDSTVQIDAVDPSERLRALITLPTFAEFVTHVAERGQGDPAAGWRFTVNSQWVVDYCLRKNGIFASPPFRAEAISACTVHGGLVAERGFNGAPISRAFAATRPRSIHTEDSNPWGMLAGPEGSEGSYFELYGHTDAETPPVLFSSGYGVGVSGWVHIGAGLGGSASAEKVIWQLWPTTTKEPRLFVHGYGDGTIAAGLFDQNGYKVVTSKVTLTSAKWHFIGVHFRWIDDSTLGVVIRTRGWGSTAGTTRTFSLDKAKVTVTPTPFYDGYRPILQTRTYFWRAFMLVQTWPGFTPPSTNSATPWRGEEHVAQADVAKGQNELAYLPDVAAAEAWEVQKAVVEAEYGVHGFTEYGRYYFRPRTDARADRVDHVLDVAVNLAEVSYSLTSDAVRNSVGITTTPANHVGKLETVFKGETADQFIVPAGSTRVWTFDWPWGAACWRGGTLPYCYQDGAETAARDASNGFAKWSGDIAHGWTYASKGASGGWTILDNTRSVIVRWVQTDTRTIKVKAYNPGPGPVRLSTAAKVDDPDSAEPALRIGGWPLKEATAKVTTYRNNASILELGGIDGGGERSLPIPSSPWRQYEPALSPIAEALLEALADEVPILADLPVRGDMRIRVGNVAECRFRDLATPVVGTVVKTNHKLDVGDGRLSSVVAVRPLPVAQLPPVDTTPTLAPAGWLFYIDISRYQEGIDLPRVKDNGYAGMVAKIGQGASSSKGYAASIDPQWQTFRDQGTALWPETTAGYWYVGDGEAPADQASRCKAALGDLSIPVMLDWEAGGGSWTNLLNVLSAFRSAGMTVGMLYTNLQSYAPDNGASAIDSATGGLSLVNSRYWVSKSTNPAQDPRAVYDDILVNRPGYGFGTLLGGTVDALQFTDAGVVYSGGPAIDVNAFPGDEPALAAMFRGP